MPGLSCGMQTVSCGMWNLVPWPGTEPGEFVFLTTGPLEVPLDSPVFNVLPHLSPLSLPLSPPLHSIFYELFKSRFYTSHIFIPLIRHCTSLINEVIFLYDHSAVIRFKKFNIDTQHFNLLTINFIHCSNSDCFSIRRSGSHIPLSCHVSLASLPLNLKQFLLLSEWPWHFWRVQTTV